MNNTPVTLKKPIGVIALAVLFILAPIGNIIISFMGSGLENWYEPQIFMSLLKTISAFDWLWLGLLFFTGVLLLKAHKLSWTVAIITLVSILAINAYRVFNIDTNSIEPHFLKVFSILAVLSTLGVLVISLYFRFPYLDRRTKWTSTQHNDDRRGQRRPSDRRKK